MNYSINETKDLFVFLAKLGNSIDGALSDGVINLMDIDELFSPAAAAKKAFEGSALIPKEVGDLDSEEASQLALIFEEEFEISNERANRLIPKGVALTTALIAFVNEVRSAKNSAEEV